MEEEPIEIDVLDSNYPLMMKLKNCPGTYAHSKNVASLMEAIGSDLKLDVVSMRIAGFYHDIGKTNCPNYYGENQSEESGNPHEELPPHISFRIIASHPAESASILINDSNISREISAWCSQHHGTTIMRYFHERSENANEENYRYKTLPPQSLEAGILMVCDQLEAKCRSLYQANRLTSIEETVNETIDYITLEDNQWDEISLTFSQIRRLKHVLYAELASMYKPKRIDYDEFQEGSDSKETKE